MSLTRSGIFLIVANTTPLFGVLLLDWRVFDILVLYWTESVIIGVINVMRMIRCRSDNLMTGMIPGVRRKEIPQEVMQQIPSGAFTAIKFFIIPFFIIHYGAFCFGHLMAVLSFFGDDNMPQATTSALQYFWAREYWIAVVAIAASHLYSYFVNFIAQGEYRNTNLLHLMQRPYGRILVMHIAIILGAGLIMWAGTPLPMLLVLIGAKIVLDLKLHYRERARLGDADRAAPGIRPATYV